MTYLKTDRHRLGSSISIISIVIACVVIVIIGVQFIAPQVLPTLFNSMAQPFWRAEFTVNAGALSSFEQLLLNNENLRRQILDANVRLETIKNVEKENEELRSLLNRASTTPKTLAAVLARPPYSAYDVLVIDIGSEYNLSTSSKVYADGGVLIGRVADISKDSSKVILFSSSGQKYEVLIGSSNLPAIATGRGGGQYEIQLPHGSNIIEGDFVTVPSLNNKPLGVVVSVKVDPVKPFETIIFSSPVNIYELRWVLVDTTNKR
ncbi:MAG: rod shape-determining protein MreC [Candidatus Paceibacterota bacterium]|jgi:cell shape-determining protein MreC